MYEYKCKIIKVIDGDTTDVDIDLGFGVWLKKQRIRFYGIDTPTKKELLAANKNNNEICEYINAKSLKFLSIDGMYKAMGFEKRNSTYPQLTDHYFTGDYPVKPIDNLGDDKVTQLSLLSTSSNN